MCDRYHRDSSKEWETLCFRDLRLLRPWCAWPVHVRQHENRAVHIYNREYGKIQSIGLWDDPTQWPGKPVRKRILSGRVKPSWNHTEYEQWWCHDNARCEAMWARMKEELLYGRYDTKQMTIEELKTLIWRYFIIYWNRRICSANGGLPPMTKRKKYYESLGQVA